MQGWLVTNKVLTDGINRDAKTMQHKCRRLIERHGLKAQLGGERGAAAELYWAAVAVLCEAGEVELGVMRYHLSEGSEIRKVNSARSSLLENSRRSMVVSTTNW